MEQVDPIYYKIYIIECLYGTLAKNYKYGYFNKIDALNKIKQLQKDKEPKRKPVSMFDFEKDYPESYDIITKYVMTFNKIYYRVIDCSLSKSFDQEKNALDLSIGYIITD